MKRTKVSAITSAVLAIAMFVNGLQCPVHAQEASATSDAGLFIRAILVAHNAWITPPNSIRIHGTLVRGNTNQPVTITANGQEEVVTEIGTSRRVATPSRQFQEDGENPVFADTQSAFGQLDITSLFLMAQLSQRAEHAGLPDVSRLNGVGVTKVHLWSDRAQMHFRQLKVMDEMDVFVDSSGLLAGIERTFYPQDSRLRYTMGYRFSDYRSVGGVLLPYRIETVFKGNAGEMILVSDYQVNVPLDRFQFQPRVQSRRVQ